MLKRTLQIFGLAFLFGLFLTLGAHAGVNLKKIQVSEGNQVHLIFDQKLTANQVKVEYLRDIIQLSLTNVSVYPAKVSTVSGSDLSKVFAYQYSPELVRCRLTVKGDANQYQGRLQMKITGKTVSLRLAPEKGDQVATAAAASARSDAKTAPEKTDKAELNPEEKQLLDRVMKNEETKAETREAKSSKSEKADRKATKEKQKDEESRKLTTGKNLPTPMRSIGIMLFIIGLLGAFLMFLKKAKGQKLFKNEAKGLSKFLGRLAGGQGRGMIEVVATHHLAPKKSIVMVKIQDRMLVLGMTNDSVNLITEFRAGEEDAASEDSMDVKAFAEGLKKFEGAQKGGQAAMDQVNGFAGILTKAFGQVAARTEKAEPQLNLGASSQSNRPSSAQAGRAPQTQPAPRNATSARPSLNAYAAPRNTSPQDAAFAESPALSAALKQESTRTSIRAQIRSKVEGLKNL